MKYSSFSLEGTVCLPQALLCAEAALPQKLSEEPLQTHIGKHISETPCVMTHWAGGELSQLKALQKKKKSHFLFFFFFISKYQSWPCSVGLGPSTAQILLPDCLLDIKIILGHVPCSPAGLARHLLALTGSPVLGSRCHQGHTGSEPGPGWWPLSLKVPQLLAPGHTEPLVLAQLLTSGPPTHMHTSWGVPHPGEELEMELKEKTGQTVVTGHWASPDKWSDQPPAWMKPDPFIPSSIHFPRLFIPRCPWFPPFPTFVSSPKNPITLRCNPQMHFVCMASCVHSP